MKAWLTAAFVVLLVVTSAAQFGQVLSGVQKAREAKDAYDSLTFTDAEERQLGESVSLQLRAKYGVVQDQAVHKYVGLMGMTLAKASSRPDIGWTFIVLDTDGVNAFASPGGFVHITRGALALIQDESELAGVLGHEIGHVTEKHTIRAIQKNKAVGLVANQSRVAFLDTIATKIYEATLENAYDRKDEEGSDKVGAILANRIGCAPTGISAFLTRLAERNKDLQERSGLFASHPDTKSRIDNLAKLIASEKLTATALGAARYKASIAYTPVAVTTIAAGATGSSGLTESKTPAKTAEKTAANEKAGEKSGGNSKFGLGGLNPLGREKAQSQTVASGGSRGVNPDRDAEGGSNPALVSVPLTPAEIEAFRKGIV